MTTSGKKDIKTNTVIVAKGKEDPALYKHELTVANAHWIDDEPKFPLRSRARIRYRHPLQNCVIILINSPSSKGESEGVSLRVLFEQLQRAVTAGQAVVFYSGKTMLGGEIIQ